ncbi:MAG: FAD/NAD(P)-binding protein [Candidatus Aenigmarchaeota archaeon]|nr:FAD/NAD(P)-binding protein [Candidatus Aenigmarchaeota archaeon]
MRAKNDFEPKIAEITAVKKECSDIYTFSCRLRNKKDKIEFQPGQFVEVAVFGVGEVPISISSSPLEKHNFDVTVKKAGSVTEALFKMKKGGLIGIRGPYGNWYPMDSFKGRNIVVVAGGVGIAPLSPVVEHIIAHRQEYGKVWLLYGTHCPENAIFNARMNRWSKNGIESIATVTKTCDMKWNGEVGHVEPMFEKHGIKADVAICCGPPRMLKDIYVEFNKMGIKDGDIYFSLERMMQCGIGKCGHCNIGRKYVCMDGPVFRKDELNELTEKIWK